jgi:hypothetical protein
MNGHSNLANGICVGNPGCRKTRCRYARACDSSGRPIEPAELSRNLFPSPDWNLPEFATLAPTDRRAAANKIVGSAVAVGALFGGSAATRRP